MIEKEVRVAVIPRYVKKDVEKICSLLQEASDIAKQLRENI